MGQDTPARHGRGRTSPAAALLWLAAAWPTGVGAAQAAEWRYCYAFEEASGRFAMSAPFRPDAAMDRVERAWREFVAKVGMAAPRTGCPRGADREEITAAMKGAAAYNRADGHPVVGLDWPAGDPVAAR